MTLDPSFLVRGLALARGLQRAPALLRCLLLGVAALLGLVLTLLAGLLVAATLVRARLFRRRPPAPRHGAGQGMPRWQPPRAASGGRLQPRAGEVVDVEAREVRD